MHWFERLLDKLKPINVLPRSGKGGIDLGGIVLYSNGDKDADLSSLRPFSTENPVYLLNMLQSFASTQHRQKVRALIVDARSISSLSELDSLLHGVGSFLPKLSKAGRIVVLAAAAPHGETFDARNLSESVCEGFVRSLAKEVGGSLVTCNLVVEHQPSIPQPFSSGSINRPPPQPLPPAVDYLLSGAAAFITSQRLDVELDGIAPPTTTIDEPDAANPAHPPLAIVTGASRGIGFRVAQLLSATHDVLSVDLSFPSHASTLPGDRLELDVSSPHAGDRLSQALKDLGLTKGGRAVSTVVHSAGITLDRTLRKMPAADYNKVLEVNLHGVVRLDDALLKGNLLSNDARVVTVSSTSGVGGNFGQTNYAASKSALLAYSVARCRAETSAGRAWNSVAPGFIDTDMTKGLPLATRIAAIRVINSLGNPGVVDDVARAIMFLANRKASGGIRGKCLRVCGGLITGR